MVDSFGYYDAIPWSDPVYLDAGGDCDQSLGDLRLADRDGNLVEYQLPRVGDAKGVIDVSW